MAGNKLYIQGYYKLHTINIPSVHARDFQLDSGLEILVVFSTSLLLHLQRIRLLSWRCVSDHCLA